MDRWVLAKARVYTCEWTAIEEARNDEIGHFHVTYSYRVGEELYTGKFIDYASGDEPPYKRDETIEIRYNPAKPSKSYYPDCRTRTNFVLICLAIGAAAGVLVCLFSAASK
jgi:hypothetical protein